MIQHQDEAEAFARKALHEIFPLLPSWGLQNPDWTKPQRVAVDERALCITISPWRADVNGRWFRVWPANTTPAGRPAVSGFFQIGDDGRLLIQPDMFRRPRARKQGART